MSSETGSVPNFPTNYWEHTDETPLGEPETDQCEFGLSPACNEEPEVELPNGRYICRFCMAWLTWLSFDGEDARLRMHQ